jgi:hypothetical protein
VPAHQFHLGEPAPLPAIPKTPFGGPPSRSAPGTPGAFPAPAEVAPPPAPTPHSASLVPAHASEEAPAMTATQVMDGKRQLKDLVNECLSPFADKSKQSPLAVCTKYLNQPVAQEDVFKSIGLHTVESEILKLHGDLKVIDFASITVDNFVEKKGVIEAMALQMDDLGQDLDKKLDEWSVTLADRKNDVLCIHLQIHS